VPYFEYETVAKAAGIPEAKLTELRRLLQEDFPSDDMTYELHPLRACMAIRDSRATIEQMLNERACGR